MTSRLEAHEQQRRHLMADIAHELRTPLTVIQGRLEGLIDGVYPRDDARLTEVLNDTRMLARLVEDLRTLAHTESGTLALHKEPTDVGVLIQEVAKAFEAESTARRVTVETQTPKDLPLVDVDPLRVREVLTNLVSNALHHTPTGGVVIDCHRHDCDRRWRSRYRTAEAESPPRNCRRSSTASTKGTVPPARVWV